MAKKLFWLALALPLASGCSTFVVKKDRMAPIKKVAIVGFSVEQERVNELHLTWVIGKRWTAKAVAASKGNYWQPGESDHIYQIYQQLASALEKDLGYNVIPADAIARNSAYQALISENRVTTRWIPMNPQPLDFFSLADIASPEKIDAFSVDERRELLQQLGADALAVAVVRVHFDRDDKLRIGKFSIGTYVPSAATTLRLYDGKDDSPIWKDLLVPGDPLNTGTLQASGITNEQSLYKMAADASALSFRKLTARCKEGLTAAN